MAAPRRPTPVNEDDLEQTAELPVIDFTATQTLSDDATIQVSALQIDEDALSRTDVFAAPSLSGTESLADNLRNLEERLHRKSNRVQELEHELERLRAEHEVALVEAREAAVRAAGDLAELSQRHAQASEKLSTLEARLAEAESQLASHADELQRRDARIEELQQDLTRSSSLARDLGRERDTLATRVQSLEGQLAANTAELREREADHSRLGASLQQRDAELRTLASERDELRRRAEIQLEALHRADGYRAVVDSLFGEHEAQLSERERELAEARAALAERDSRVVALESELGELRGRLADQEQRFAALQADARALETRVEELDGQVAAGQRSAEAQSEALRVAADHAREIEQQLATERETVARLQAEAEARVAELTHSAEDLKTRLSDALRQLGEREEQVRRLEADAHASAAVLANLQQSIQRLTREDTGSYPALPEKGPENVARLLVRTDGDAEVVHVLGRRTTIGRTPDNDIRLDANFVSRHHAVVLAGPRHTVIEDLNSTNGVLVNGRRVTRTVLNEGDTVSIGPCEFRFQVRPLASPAADADPT